ncbi:MAG: hypothetical protein JSU92_04835, partial [Deltaproteobacteria bacterium]
MKKKGVLNLLVIIVIINLFSLSPASAEIAIEVIMDESFGIGEDISFDYSIVSDETQTIHYMPHIMCPRALVPLLDIKTVELIENEPVTGSYEYLTIDENIGPQTCAAAICIMSFGAEGEPPEVIQTEGVIFTIDVSPSFKISLLTCKDQACTNKAKVFILNDTMQLNYESELSGVSVAGLLTRPDASTRELT